MTEAGLSGASAEAGLSGASAEAGFSSHPGHRPGTAAYRRLNLAMLMAGIAGFGLLYSTQPLLPDLSRAFDVSPTTAALTVSAGTGGLAIAVVLVTGAAQHLGRHRVMRAALLTAVALELLSAASPTFGVLVALRVLLGICLAGVLGVAMSHVGAEVHPEGLGRAMGLYVAGNTLGGVGGRLVTSTVGDVASWRVADLVLGVFALVAAVAFLVLLPPSVAPPVAPSVVAPTQRATTAPRARHRVRGEAFLLLLVPFLLMGGFVATYNYLTYRLAAAPFDLPSGMIGLVFLAYLAGTVSSTIAGALADRLGRGPVIITSLVVMGGGVALMVPDHLVTVVAGLVVMTAGFFGAHAVASGWVPVVAPEWGARASGAYVFMYYAGSSVVGALAGQAWTHGGWDATAAVVGALVVAGLACAVVVAIAVSRRRDDPSRPRRMTTWSRESRTSSHLSV